MVIGLTGCDGRGADRAAEDLAAEDLAERTTSAATEPVQVSAAEIASTEVEAEQDVDPLDLVAIRVEDADCRYVDDELSAAERLSSWRIARDEFLGIPHDVTTDERLEQRTLLEISSDYGYTESTLVGAAELIHTECFDRLVKVGELTQEQADNRVARSVESFASLMNSTPDADGRGAGPRDDSADVPADRETTRETS